VSNSDDIKQKNNNIRYFITYSIHGRKQCSFGPEI
jgi:hypothetical protein